MDGDFITTYKGTMLKAADENKTYFLHSQLGEAKVSLISLDNLNALQERICEGKVTCMSNILEESNNALV